MKFNGKIKNGKFVPNAYQEPLYNLYLSKWENSGFTVQIELKKPERHSTLQMGLFNKIITEVAKYSGHTSQEVMTSIRHLRLMEDGEYKEFGYYSTSEMTLFIENVIMFLNDFFELNVRIDNESSTAKITNEPKQD